jgi:hypothetical protein
MTGFGKLTYVTINEQVTLQNQDPVDVFIRAGLKPWVIDLEALTFKSSVTRAKDFLKDVHGIAS